MNIDGLNNHLKAKDILQKCELLSLAFNLCNDETIKRLSIFNYNRKCDDYIEFPKDMHCSFRKTNKYNSLVGRECNEKPTNAETTSFIMNNGSSLQIFIGSYDERLVFLDPENEIIFFVKNDFLKTYLNELLIFSNHTLFERDFNEIKNMIIKTDIKEFICYEIIQDMG